jgi:hypothetical protein
MIKTLSLLQSSSTVAVAPIILVRTSSSRDEDDIIDVPTGLFAFNAFEPLLWVACIWCIVRVITQDEPRYWIWFGLLTGLTMELKYTIAFSVGLPPYVVGKGLCRIPDATLERVRFVMKGGHVVRNDLSSH